MIDIKTERICAYLKSCKEVLAAYFYGSYINGRAGKGSDLDIALLFLPGGKITNISDKEIKYALSIEKKLEHVEADVKIINSAPLFFQYKIISEGKLIFCRDNYLRIKYEIRTTIEYFDFKPFLDYYNQCMYQNIKEGYRGFRSSRD
ncbi:MAG: nucleotidyltransferase domain-containing protein [Candidatus Omnitrophota bacterium]